MKLVIDMNRKNNKIILKIGQMNIVLMLKVVVYKSVFKNPISMMYPQSKKC